MIVVMLVQTVTNNVIVVKSNIYGIYDCVLDCCCRVLFSTIL